MARYVLYLRSAGKSPRTLSGVYSDLEAAGMLVISYDYPTKAKAGEILNLFLIHPGLLNLKENFPIYPMPSPDMNAT